MSKKRNPTIPFGNFYHPPLNLPEIMIERGCAHATDLSVMHGLFSLVQFHKTERVGKYDLFTGDTCVVSHERLANRCFFNEKTIRRSIERLKDAGLIIQHKQGVCFWYHITIYDEAIEYLKRNSGHPMESVVSPVGSESKRQAIYDDAKLDSVPDNSDSVPADSDIESSSQESLQEALQEPPVSNGPGPNEVAEKRGGDSINLEDEELDVAQSKQIAEVKDVVEALAKDKRMSSQPTDDGVESFILSFNEAFDIESTNVPTRVEVDSASKLKSYLEGRLRAVLSNMPPLLFFKKFCVTRTHELMENGEMTEPPKYPTFYVEAVTGKEIVDNGIDKMRSASGAKKAIDRTSAYLDELRGRESSGISPENQALIDKQLGRL